MHISLIAALSENFVIGKDKGMPWHMPEDLKFFFKTTQHHHVVMGRKTFQEFGIRKPLSNRVNLVVSKELGLQIPGTIVLNTIDAAINLAKKAGENELFIIGGGNIYKQTIDIAYRLYLTYIHTIIENGDVFFPKFNKTNWNLISEDKRTKDQYNPFDYTFKLYERREN